MTLFLEQLWKARPVEQRIPPRALASDKIPWSGDEVARFAEIFDDLRHFSDPANRPAGADPDYARLARVCCAHLEARLQALFESWAPQGKPN